MIRKQRFEQTFKLWRRVLSLLRGAAPLVSVAVIVVTVFEAVTGLIVLYAIKLLVDTISVELAAQSDGISNNVLIMLALTSLAFLFAALFQILANTLRLRQGLTVSDYVDREIHERAISVGLRYYESPEYYDTLERAREGGSGRPAQLVTNTVITFRAAITLIGIFILIGSIEYRLLPALLLPILLALIVRLYFVRKLFDWRMSRAQRERRATYLDLIMTKAMHAKDLRINGIGPFFRDQYSTIRKDLRDGEIKIDQARSWSDFLMATIGVVIFIAACAWLLHQSLEQARPIGDVVLFVMLLRQGERSGNELASNTAKIVNDHLYLQRLFEFLAVPAQAALGGHSRKLPETASSELNLSNVAFRYDGANTHALKNISLKIKAGEVVALVGENGSGKTSLIKLLTRLYDPTEGNIKLDGVDIREFDPQEYRKKFSVVFQDYAIYANTVSDNIRFGDVSLEASPASIEAAAQSAGASEFIESLPHAYQTPLMKLFDNGHDLSIGQWQRIALARALYPKSEFLILDEPTSAMDPKAEFDLFEDFKSRIGGRAALIISHRLSTVRQADFIYVLKSGEIVEQGTHDELVKAKGNYANLFDKQARFYT